MRQLPQQSPIQFRQSVTVIEAVPSSINEDPVLNDSDDIPVRSDNNFLVCRRPLQCLMSKAPSKWGKVGVKKNNATQLNEASEEQKKWRQKHVLASQWSRDPAFVAEHVRLALAYALN